MDSRRDEGMVDAGVPSEDAALNFFRRCRRILRDSWEGSGHSG